MPSSQSTAVAATAATAAAAYWYLGDNLTNISSALIPSKIDPREQRLTRARATAPAAQLKGIPSGDSDIVRGKKTIVELMQWRAATHPDKIVHTYLDDQGKEVDAVTFRMMDEAARAVAGMLHEQGVKKGDRVILCFPPGIEFINAFWGCLYAGAVAVPVYPPHPANLRVDLPKFDTLVKDSGAKIALTNKEYYLASTAGTIASMAKRNGSGWPSQLKWHLTDSVSLAYIEVYNAHQPNLGPEDVAFFQYSSGSTSTPKAVMIAHKCIMAQMYTWDSIQPSAIHISWLPSYHDMGLVGYIIVPCYTASHCVQFSPIGFIKNPFLWLYLITKYKATHTCAPNFAYALTARKVTDAQLDELDLSSLYAAICAAEPIRKDTLDQFTEKFSPVGFRREAWNCGYGLAEVTLTCTRQDPYHQIPPVVLTLDKQVLENLKVARDHTEDSRDSVQLVGCGFECPKHTVLIVNPESRARLEENRVGEIWVSGESNTVGYWGQEEKSATALCASISGEELGDHPRYLRTGDLGFFRNKQLYVCGRIKDIIIIRGRNILPQDVELTVETMAGGDIVRPGCSAAFSVDIGGEERLVVVCELRQVIKGDNAKETLKQLKSKLNEAVAKDHQVNCHGIVFIMPRSIPKTTSGKIQRHAAKQNFLDGNLKTQFSWVADIQTAAAVQAGASLPVSTVDIAEIEGWLLAAVGRRRGGEEFPATMQWSDMGLDSIAVVEMSADLGSWLGIVVPATMFFEHDTPRTLSVAVHGMALGRQVLHTHPASSQPRKVYEMKAEYSDIASFPEVKTLKQALSSLKEKGFASPFLAPIETHAANGRAIVNYNTYNYLGLTRHPEVQASSKKAIDEYGTSMSSSPVVGQNALNIALESALAKFLGAEAVCLFLGGHSTNVTTIGHLVGSDDLILCDSLNHNSIVLGQKLSGATVITFPHNNVKEADRILTSIRKQYRRVLITIEGVYSMDGDYADLPAFIELKRKHHALLYVDEAHSIGTLGETGRGVAEHFNVSRGDVDIWMGTLSKAFGSAGGFIAGSSILVDYLKHSCGGFVFSCGLTPANSSAALASVSVMDREPERVKKLQENSISFYKMVKELGFNTGSCIPGTAVVPIIIGDSQRCVALSDALYKRGVNVKPIVFPAVEESASRLRFFMTQEHTTEDLEYTVSMLKELNAAILGQE